MYRKHLSYILLIVLLLPCLLLGCSNPMSIGVVSEDGIALEYKYGEITLLDGLSAEKEIYTDRYPDDIFVPRDSVSLREDQIIYMFNAVLSAQDGNGRLTSLCCDPLCDHMQRETCIVSYRPIRCAVQRDTDVFFLKGNGVYRYSVETYKVTPYAVFSAMVSHMFAMGRFLYVRILNEAYVKIDLEADTGEIIPIDSLEPIAVYPSEGRLYCLDQAMNICVCDQNMQIMDIPIQNIRPDCYIQQCFQVYGDRIYYVNVQDERHQLCIYDMTDGQSEVYEDVYCFAIAEDQIYMMLYDPMPFCNEYKETAAAIPTANKLYCAPIGDIDHMRLLATFNDGDWQIGGYWLWATGRYVYTEADRFTEDSMETSLRRYCIETDTWEELKEEDV